MSAAVLAVSSVQLDVPVTGALVLEQPGTELASEGHLIRMRLFMFLEIGKPWESFVAELALVGGVLGGAESEGWLGLCVGSVGGGGGGGWRR